MELETYLEENGFTKLNSMENVNHQTFQRQHTLVSIWGNSVAVNSYGRVQHTGRRDTTINYLENLKTSGRNH